MDYQAMYQKYQNALKFRELSIDVNYTLLNETFNKKIMDSINLNTQSHFIPYLAGIKEVFFYVNQEAGQVDFYRDELDRIISAE